MNVNFPFSDIYECSANNVYGVVRKLFKIKVNAAPYIDDKIAVQRDFNGNIGDKFTLKCGSIIANPPPMYVWFKDK